MKPNTPDNVEGMIREVNGNFKEAAGKLTKNPRLENSGRREKTLGKGQRIHNSVESSIGEYGDTDYEKRGTMSQTILERTAEHISDATHQASRATRAAADAIDDGVGAVRRVAKQGGDVAEEFFNDASRLIERQPVLTVAATAALALGAGVFIGWMMQRKGSR
jgi:uncharacterized protein YjbJ (UPF0337 family)